MGGFLYRAVHVAYWHQSHTGSTMLVSCLRWFLRVRPIAAPRFRVWIRFAAGAATRGAPRCRQPESSSCFCHTSHLQCICRVLPLSQEHTSHLQCICLCLALSCLRATCLEHCFVLGCCRQWRVSRCCWAVREQLVERPGFPLVLGTVVLRRGPSRCQPTLFTWPGRLGVILPPWGRGG